MNPLISIIIPVYNAEKYLNRCIDSILNQTYKNLEIVLINDGSTDRSGEICQKYSQSDIRIIYIEQKNVGQGVTRSRGVEICKGDYIAFVDDDDYILPTMYETMLNAITNNQVDMCVCQWNYELPDGTHTINNKIYDENFYGKKSSVEFAQYLYKYNNQENYGYANGLVVSPWNKLFKKEIIKGVKAEGYLGEDEEMNDWINSKNCSVIIIKDEFYYWCQNLNSMSNKPFSDKKYHFLDALEKRRTLFSDKYIIRETEKLYCNIFIEYYYKAKKNNVTILPKYNHTFKNIYFSLLKSKYCHMKFYLRVLIFIISPNIYRNIVLK